MHPEDRARVEAALSHALSPEGDGRLAVEARVLASDGRMRWIAAQQQIAFAPEEGAQRTARSAVIVVRDISARRSREERIAFLMREVNHRSKNMLALVQAMARQTMAAGQDNFFERFSSASRRSPRAMTCSSTTTGSASISARWPARSSRISRMRCGTMSRSRGRR